MADELPGTTGVVRLAELLLSCVVDEFEAAGVDLPARRYLTHGQTAADCDQLTVSIIQIYRGLPGAPPSEPTTCSSPTSAVIEIEILRKVPNLDSTSRGNMVDRDRLDASGRAHMRDMELLLSSTCRMSPPRYFWNGGIFADINAGDTQGDYAGPKMTVTAQV